MLRAIYDPQTLDQRILELNKIGYSLREISIDVGRPKTTVDRHLKDLRQDPDNGVVTIHKRWQPKTKGKWYKIIEEAQKEISYYVKTVGQKPSIRAISYTLQDKTVDGIKILKPEEYDRFVDATVDARLGVIDSDDTLTYPKLNIDCFADDDRKLFENYDNHYPISSCGPEDPEEYIEYAINQLRLAPKRYYGEGTPAQPGGYWYGQSEYVEAWQEKEALAPIFEMLLKEKHVNIATNKGYSSLIFLYKNCERLKPLAEAFGPEHIHIKYNGDMDPSGNQIDDYVKKRLKKLGIPPTAFERIAVTHEQIVDLNLPLMRINMDDPRSKGYIEKYGKKATHLDALTTKKHINDFRKILHEAIDKHYDKDIYEDMLEKYDPNDYEIPSKANLKASREKMCKTITEAFKPGWDNEYK